MIFINELHDFLRDNTNIQENLDDQYLLQRKL